MSSATDTPLPFRLDNPPRSLTPGMQRYLKRRSSSCVKLIVVMSVGLPGLLMILIAMLNADAPSEVALGGWITIGVAVLIYLLLTYLSQRRTAKLRSVLENGRVKEVKVLSISLEYNVQLNGRPRSLIQLELNGEMVELRTFDDAVVAGFRAGPTAQVLYWDGAPGTMIPLSTLAALESGSVESRKRPRQFRA